MESMGVLQNEDCQFLNKFFPNNEEADFTYQFWEGFGNPTESLSTNEANVNANVHFAHFDENFYSSSENFNTSFYHSQENTNFSTSSNNYSACFPNVSHGSPRFCGSNIIPMDDISKSMNIFLMDEENNASAKLLSTDHYVQDVVTSEAGKGTADVTDLGIKTKFEMLQQPEAVAIVENIPKKRCRVPRDIPKYKKNVQAKRNKRVTQSVNIDAENNLNGLNGESSSTYSSEDDSNASQELNNIGATSYSTEAVALNSSGKPRAGRGAATDPQSLYARKRREKINDRLRILQNLVPNGTKVDISTMLEEAVHYVKFLQLQIKLLSSDEMWMYAPIAYNGMDMGLYQNISQAL